MSRSASGESNDGKEDREEAAADKLGGKVVDEKTVTKSNKPRNRSVGEALVRLYGSYQHLYVDPIKCHSQFKIVLEQNNGSHREIFDKALDREARSIKTGKRKSKGSKSKGNSSKKEKVSKKAKLDKEGKKAKRKSQTKDVAESPKMRTSKKNKILNNDELENEQSDI